MFFSFDFCLPNDDSKAPVENLGQVVFGERIQPSPYKIKFLKEEKCVPVCTKTYTAGVKEDIEKLLFIKKGISLNYQHHWIVGKKIIKLLKFH